MKNGTKRTYTKEFKKEAVRLYEATEKSQAEIERELGITEGLLSKWIKRLQEEGEQAFPGKGILVLSPFHLKKGCIVFQNNDQTFSCDIAIP